MPVLNLKADTPAQQLVKEYLEKSASATLADKINHGVKIQKDGKTVLNKKDMDGFMRFAFEQAKKQANKSKDNAFVEDPVVYGWAIHYFEEETIEGTLYNEDGTVYKPAQTGVTRSPAPVVSSIPSEKKPKPQMSLFELIEQKAEVSETDIDTDIEDESEETEDEAEPLPETEETLPEIPQAAPVPLPEKEIPAPVPVIQPQSSPLYQRYMKIQAQYPDAVIVLRHGDFYEILGENAVKIAAKLDLTLTSRDCGLESRVPMVGFPVHSSDMYISKLLEKGYTLAIVEKSDEIRIQQPELKIDKKTGELLPPVSNGDMPHAPSGPPDDEPEDDLQTEIDAMKAFDPVALAKLYEILGDELDLQ